PDAVRDPGRHAHHLGDGRAPRLAVLVREPHSFNRIQAHHAPSGGLSMIRRSPCLFALAAVLLAPLAAAEAQLAPVGRPEVVIVSAVENPTPMPTPSVAPSAPPNKRDSRTYTFQLVL